MPEFLELMENWKGYAALSDVNRPEGYDKQLTEIINLLGNANNLPQHKHEYLLREAMTTPDFAYLFADVLGRELLAAYKGTPANWPKYTKVSKVKDFRVNKRFRMTDGDQVLPLVAEKGEYLASSRTTTKYEIQALKYGRQFDISYEAIINDDLGAIKDTPQRMALAANRTEQRVIISLYAGDLGTHAGLNLYQNGINASNALLTIANLETALETMAAVTDANTEPILNKAKYLVVPPSLELTAHQILTSATKMWTEHAAGAGPRAYPMTNVVSQMGLELIIEPYLPILNTTDANTQWYLFSDPKDLAVLEAVRMSGHENPEVCMKASDKVTLGGAAIAPMSGDFATDNIFYRVRLIFGGATEDWRGTYAGGLPVAVEAL